MKWELVTLLVFCRVTAPCAHALFDVKVHESILIEAPEYTAPPTYVAELLLNMELEIEKLFPLLKIAPPQVLFPLAVLLWNSQLITDPLAAFQKIAPPFRELPLTNFIPLMTTLLPSIFMILTNPLASRVDIASSSRLDPPIIVKLFLLKMID